LVELFARIAHRFRQPEVRERAGRYLAGLLGRVHRKAGWQLVEAMGEREQWDDRSHRTLRHRGIAAYLYRHLLACALAGR
jgi:hypothetical protein